MDVNSNPIRKRIQPIRALGAIRALVRNPDDTPKVFEIVDALSGNAGERIFQRFRRTPAGARILEERPNLLATLVVAFCVLGSYVSSQNLSDIWILFGFSVFGLLMILNHFPLPAFVIGFILGPMAEKALRSGLMESHGSMLPLVERPIPLFLMIVSVALVVWVVVRTRRVESDAPLTSLLPEGQAPLAWIRNGDGLVAWGVAARVATAGADRFDEALAWWSQLQGASHVRDDVRVPGSGLVCLGSFAFADDPPHAWIRGTWEGMAADQRVPVTSAEGPTWRP